MSFTQIKVAYLWIKETLSHLRQQITARFQRQK